MNTQPVLQGVRSRSQQTKSRPCGLGRIVTETGEVCILMSQLARASHGVRAASLKG